MVEAIPKFEFGSAEWLSAARKHITDGLNGSDLTGVEYAMCCEYTDPPAHLLQHGQTSIAWFARIRSGHVEFGERRIATADFQLTIDWEVCREMGRVVRKLPGGAERFGELVERAKRAGKLRGSGYDEPGPDVFEKLDLHDYLAVRTL